MVTRTGSDMKQLQGVNITQHWFDFICLTQYFKIPFGLLTTTLVFNYISKFELRFEVLIVNRKAINDFFTNKQYKQWEWHTERNRVTIRS